MLSIATSVLVWTEPQQIYHKGRLCRPIPFVKTTKRHRMPFPASYSINTVFPIPFSARSAGLGHAHQESFSLISFGTPMIISGLAGPPYSTTITAQCLA